MKNYVSKYSDAAKTALGSISTLLIAVGIYDPTTMSLMVGSAMAFGTAFWQVYDLATKD